jgi:CubicO group peptidase (beta-lactamase class C family)
LFKNILTITILAILIGEGACTTSPKPSASVTSDELSGIIERYRQEITQLMEQEHVPGLAIAVVDDQSILWTEGFGCTDWDRCTPVTPDTLFSIQSMSKSFTATAAMFAAQDGLVDLDEPITTYLPDFHVNSIFEEHPEQKITMRMLLSHTAGFVHEAPIGGNNDLPNHTFEEHIASISNTWLRFPVGTHWAYSNLGIDLAGYILQVRSGMPFTQYMQQKVLDPLGMTHSTMDYQQVRGTKDRAIGHNPITPFRPPVKLLIIPAGGVWTTAKDIAYYLQFHINEGVLDGRRLLRQDLAETMYEPPNPAALEANYALGLGAANWQGTRRLSHGGGGFGFNSNMIWYPDLKLGAVVLTNVEDAGSAIQIIEDVLGSIIATNIPLYHSRATTSPSVQPAYAFIQDGLVPITDAALSKLIASKNLPLDDAELQQRQKYLGSYVQTKWGFPLTDIQVKEINGKLIATAQDQNIVLNEVQPGLLFDPQGTASDLHMNVHRAPNYPNYKINTRLLPLRIVFYAICGIVFLITLFFWPVHTILQRVLWKKSPPVVPAAISPPVHWLRWEEILAGMASFFSLVCLGFIVFIPNLIYVPWPRPYADLTCWQYSFLSLPFANLLMGVVIAFIAGLTMQSLSWGRTARFYNLMVALALLIFNLVIIL